MFDPTRLSISLALLGLGCQPTLTDIGSELGDDESSSAQESSTSTGDAEAGDAEAGETQTGETQTGDTQDEGQAQLVAASGIGIVEIEANQGVQIPLTVGTDWLAPEQRKVRLVSGRETLLRVHWQVAEGWQPHPVTFRLRVGELLLEQELLVSGDSERGSLDQSANWLLPAAEAVLGSEFEVELLELDLEQDGELGELGSTAPSDGPQPLGYEPGPMELELVFVPIHYTGGGLDTQPELSAETLAPLLDRLYELTPVAQVQWSVREPYEWSSELLQLGELIVPLASLRVQDGAEPQVYYYAFIDPGCVSEDCTLQGISGLALSADDSMDAPRVGVGTLFEVESATHTTVHELAHAQGLTHAPCPLNNPFDADPSYPYPDGTTGVWGYALRSGTLYDPASSSSFMSYCPNPWVSDWEWNKLFERVQTLSAW